MLIEMGSSMPMGLAVALGCGLLIGVERQTRMKGAGPRIHMMVSLGAALMTLVSSYGFLPIVGAAGVSVDVSRVAASIAAGIGYRDYQPGGGHDTIYTAELAATWWLNRYLGLTARLRHENLNSTLPDRDARTDSVYLGLKAQR